MILELTGQVFILGGIHLVPEDTQNVEPGENRLSQIHILAESHAGGVSSVMGFAGAMTEHLACRLVTTSALLMEMLCCSVASWMNIP